MVLTIYNIVKTHGGTIVVTFFNGSPGEDLKELTEVGVGSEFILQLPLSESRMQRITRMAQIKK